MVAELIRLKKLDVENYIISEANIRYDTGVRLTIRRSLYITEYNSIFPSERVMFQLLNKKRKNRRRDASWSRRSWFGRFKVYNDDDHHIN